MILTIAQLFTKKALKIQKMTLLVILLYDINMVFTNISLSFTNPDFPYDKDHKSTFYQILHLIIIEDWLNTWNIVFLFMLILFIFLVSMLTLVALSIMVSPVSLGKFWNFKIFNNRNFHSFLLQLSSILLRISLIVSLETMHCHQTDEIVKMSNQSSLESEFQIKNPSSRNFGSPIFKDGGSETTITTKYYSDFNNSLLCYTFQYYALTGFLLSSIFIGFVLIITSSRIIKVLFPYQNRNSNINIFSSILELIIISLGIFSRYFIKGFFGYTEYIIFSSICLGVFCTFYIVIATINLGLNKISKVNLLSRLLVLSSIQFFIILDKNHINVTNTSVSDGTWAISAILILLAYKLHLNIINREQDFSKLINRVGKNVFSVQDFDSIYESLTQTIVLTTSFDSDQVKTHRYKTFWRLIEEQHSLNCSNTSCFCKNQHIKIPEGVPYWRAVLLMEVLYKQTISRIANKRHLFIAYINFLIDIKGDLISAQREIKGARQEKGKESESSMEVLTKRDIHLFKLKISQNVELYSRDRTFIRRFATFHTRNSLSKYNNFLKECEKFAEETRRSEELILKIVDKKHLLYDEVLHERRVKYIYNYSIEISGLIGELSKVIKRLGTLTRGRHMYFVNLQLLFNLRIKPDPVQALNYLKKLRKRYTLDDLGYLLKKESIETKDTIVLGVGFEVEKNHRILLVSGGTEQILGYTENELQGSDLGILLPSELRQVHRRIMNSESFYSSRVESNKFLDTFCKRKNGSIVKMSLYIKVAYLEYGGLQGFSLLQFDKQTEKKDKIVLAVDREGKVSEATQEGMEIFGLGRHISNLSADMAQNLSILSVFYDNHSQKGLYPSYDPFEVINNDYDALVWELYLKWKNPQLVVLRRKNGTPFYAKMSLDVHHFGKGSTFGYLWLLRISDNSKNDFFKTTIVNGYKSAYKSRFMEKSTLENELVKIFRFRGLQNGANNFIEPENGKYQETRNLNKRISQIVSQISDSKINQDKVLKKLETSKYMDKKFISQITLNKLDSSPKSQLIHSRRKAPRDRWTSIILQHKYNTVLRSMGVFKKGNIDGSRGDGCSSENEENPMTEFQSKRNNYESKKMPQSLKNLFKLHKGLIVIEKFKNNSKRIYTWIALCIIAVLYSAIMTICTELFHNFKLMAFKEIKGESTIINDYISIILGGHSPVSKVEICRIMGEGVVPEGLMIEYGSNSLENCLKYEDFGAEMDIQWNLISNTLGNSKFTRFIDKDKILGRNIEVEIVQLITNTEESKNDVLRFEEINKNRVKMSFSEAVTFNSGFASFFGRRNYSINSSIPNYLDLESRPRYLDIEEEQFRINHLHSFPKALEMSFSAFKDYLKLLIDLNLQVVWIRFITGIVLSNGFILVVLISISLQIKRSNELYSQILAIKTKEIFVYIKSFKKQASEIRKFVRNKGKIRGDQEVSNTYYKSNIPPLTELNSLFTKQITSKEKEKQFSQIVNRMVSQKKLSGKSLQPSLVIDSSISQPIPTTTKNNNKDKNYVRTAIKKSRKFESDNSTLTQSTKYKTSKKNQIIKSKANQFNSSQKVKKQKLKVRTWFLFRYERFIILTLIILGLEIILEAYIFVNNYNSANKVSQSMKIVLMSNDLLNEFQGMKSTLLETVLYNDTVVINNKQSSLAFYEYLEQFRTSTEQQMAESLSYDLGDFTASYRKYIRDSNPCGQIILVGEEEKYCEFIFGGILKQPILKGVKEMSLLLEQTMELWKEVRGTRKGSDRLLSETTMLSLMGQMSGAVRSVYNWISGASGSFLIQVLEAESQGIEALENYVYIGKILLNIGLIIGINGYFLRTLIKRSLFILEIFPIELLEKNKYLMNIYLKQYKLQK